MCPLNFPTLLAARREIKAGIIGYSGSFVKINLSGKISMGKMEILPDKLMQFFIGYLWIFSIYI